MPLSLGVNLKFIKQSIDSESGSSFAGDIGLLYMTPNYFTIGLAIRNIGNGLAIYEESFPLPLTYSIGIGYYSQEHFNLGFDIDKERDSDLVYKLGIEYFLYENLDLRAGYMYSSDDYDNIGVTVGFGFNIAETWFLDYAYVPFDDLSDAHRFSLKYTF
jgi:opacity protein-like surface antigen